jgi:hypothetical protein
MDNMADVQGSGCAAEPPAIDELTPMPATTTRLLHIILIAIIAIAFTTAFLIAYSLLNNVIWFDNDFIAANRWMIPVLVLAF